MNSVISTAYTPDEDSWEHAYLAFAKQKLKEVFSLTNSTVARKDLSKEDLDAILALGNFPSAVESIYQTGKATHQMYLLDYKGTIPGGTVTNQNILFPSSISPWHTNHWFPGKRRYYVWNNVSGSFFRYRDITTGEIITDYESAGWTRRTFEFPDEQHDVTKMLWHCVFATDIRVVFGCKPAAGD